MWFLLPALFACRAPDTVAAWAWDPIWLEPTAGDGAHGFQTWQLYGEGWSEDYDEVHFVCAVVVELEGAPTACDAEDACSVAWAFEAQVLETDCAETSVVDEPLLTSVKRVALGAAVPGDDLPWPGLTSVGWVDYGGGWETHGKAWPEALDLGRSVSSGAWDGVEPFQFVPDQAFPWPPTAP